MYFADENADQEEKRREEETDSMLNCIACMCIPSRMCIPAEG
jgi:hypothetical protein